MRRLTTVDSTGRRTKISVKLIDLPPLLRVAVNRKVERDRVVDSDFRTLVDLVLPRDHDLVARLHATEHRHSAVTHRSQFDEAPLDLEIGLLRIGVWILGLNDREHAVAVKRIGHRRLRYRHDRLWLAYHHLHIGIHAGYQTAVGIVDLGPDRDHPARR